LPPTNTAHDTDWKIAMPAMTMGDARAKALPARHGYAEVQEIDRWSRARTLAFIGISSTLLWVCIGGAVALVW
jgi:hypothetical protein